MIAKQSAMRRLQRSTTAGGRSSNRVLQMKRHNSTRYSGGVSLPAVDADGNMAVLGYSRRRDANESYGGFRGAAYGGGVLMGSRISDQADPVDHSVSHRGHLGLSRAPHRTEVDRSLETAGARRQPLGRERQHRHR